MAITQSFPKATPGLKDLLLGTKVEKDSIATRNFTVSDIVDLSKDNMFRPYKVFTALLTQDGESDPYNIGSVDLIIGATYLIQDDSGDADFTNVGAPNNNVGTFFVATETTPNSWGSYGTLRYDGGAPVATVLENTIGNIWFTYESIGTYNIMSNALFTNNKTYCSATLSNYKYDSSNVMLGRANDSMVQMITLLPTVSHFDDSDTSIEIRVYN